MVLTALIVAFGATLVWSLMAAWLATTALDELKACVMFLASMVCYSALAVIDTLHRLARGRPAPPA